LETSAKGNIVSTNAGYISYVMIILEYVEEAFLTLAKDIKIKFDREAVSIFHIFLVYFMNLMFL
jgi:hypothetical protein